MKENVGREDRLVRFVTGPIVFAIGYGRLGGRQGRSLGLATMIAGVLIVESAITAVCPLNAALGVDTRR
jgi:hypothetical protein